MPLDIIREAIDNPSSLTNINEPGALRSILATAGAATRALFHFLYPNTVEAYMMILELVNYKNQRVNSLVFPIMPSALAVGFPQVTKITKSQSTVGVLKNSGFVPKPVSIQGTFGRGIVNGLTGGDIQGLTRSDQKFIESQSLASRFNKEDSTKKHINTALGEVFKRFNTAYGWTKALQKLGEDAQETDGAGKRPRTMYLFCPPLGINYAVEWMNFSMVESARSSNRMIMYKLQLYATADLNVISESGSDSGNDVKQYLRNVRKFGFYSLIDFTNAGTLNNLGIASIPSESTRNVLDAVGAGTSVRNVSFAGRGAN